MLVYACISVTLAQPLHNLVAKVSPGTIMAPATAVLRGPYLIQEHNSLPNGRTSRGCVRFNCYIPHIIYGFNTTCYKVVATAWRPTWADFLHGAGNNCPYATTPCSYLFCTVSCPEISNLYLLCSFGGKPAQNSRLTCLRRSCSRLFFTKSQSRRLYSLWASKTGGCASVYSWCM